MDAVVVALEAQQEELRSLVADLDDGALAAPSRCPGWSVADVLLHLAQTNELAVASVEGRLAEQVADVASRLPRDGTIDDWAGALVALERGSDRTALERWLASAGAQTEAFAGCAPDTRLLWVAGELAARSLATTRLTEAWIHTVDVATGLGVEVAPTDRLRHTARLAWRTIPYAFSRGERSLHGPVAFALTGPAGDRWTFGDPETATTVVTGSAVELCEVAGQRASAAETGLSATGPDGEDVLALVRTFA